MAFAEKTSVSPEKTRFEIEALLKRHKATGFCSGFNGPALFVQFQVGGLMVQFRATVPKGVPAARRAGTKKPLAQRQADADAQSDRSTWRRLGLCIKAKLEAVATGIETFEQALLAHVVTASGETVGELVMNQVRAGNIPLMLPAAQNGGHP